MLTLALYPSGESEGPVCARLCLAVSGQFLFLFYIFKKNEFLDIKESTKKRRTILHVTISLSDSITRWHLKWALGILKWAPPPTSQFYSFKLEFGDRWAESIDKLCKKNEIFEWKKPRKHFMRTLGTKKPSRSVTVSTILRILLEIFGVFLAFAQVCTSQHGFSGDHNRDWNNFIEITQGRPSFFLDKENTRKTEVSLLVYSRSCKFLWEIWGKRCLLIAFMPQIIRLLRSQPWLKYLHRNNQGHPSSKKTQEKREVDVTLYNQSFESLWDIEGKRYLFHIFHIHKTTQVCWGRNKFVGVATTNEIT